MDVTNDNVSVILYGAGMRALPAYLSLKSEYNVVCLVDGDSCKHGSQYAFSDGVELPVFSLEFALEQFPAAKIWITPSPPVKYEIINFLLFDFKIDMKKIINYEHVMKRTSCTPAEETLVFADGHIQTCCTKEDVPICRYDNAISNKEFTDMLNEYKDNISHSLDKADYPHECIGCRQIREAIWPELRVYKEIILISGSMCQFRCVYCGNDEGSSAQRQRNLARTLELIKYLKDIGYITSATHFSISNGEITINPLRNAVYDTIRGMSCTFFTNAEIYSEEIAEFLRIGNSAVNISLDSGTPETFTIVKGKNSFDKVTNSIRRYAKAGSVELKYIVLPGINDNDRDVDGFIKIASEVNAKILLSRDSHHTDEFDKNISSCLQTISRIIVGAKANNLQMVNILGGFCEQSRFADQISGLFEE